MVAVNKRLSAVGAECAALRWSRNEVLSKLKTLETDLGELLKAVSEQTTDDSSIMSKQFETGVVQGLERTFA